MLELQQQLFLVLCAAPLGVLWPERAAGVDRVTIPVMCAPCATGSGGEGRGKAVAGLDLQSCCLGHVTCQHIMWLGTLNCSYQEK